MIATAQAQHGRDEPLSLRTGWKQGRTDGDGALAAPANAGPLLLAQAPSLSALDVVASTAAPRPGRGESALIDVAPASAQPPQNNVAPVPAVAPILAQGAPPTATADQPAALGTGLKLWKVAPIRWGGYLAIDLQGVGAQGQPRQVRVVELANLKASSYIWQPWFAQVSGELNLITSQRREGGGSPGAPVAAGSGIKSTGLTGGGQLSLFPVSRFPFTASFSETDSRASGELVNNPYTVRRYGLTQGYAPPQGGSSYRLSYNRSDVASDAFGTDKALALAAGMNWSGGANAVSINGNGYTNTRSNSGDASSMNTVYATHSYRPGPAFAVESLANFNTTEYHLANSGLPMNTRSRFLQLNSFATWRPGENSPLLLIGGARLYQNSAGANGVSADTRTISANAAATYTLDRNTTLSGAGVITQTSNGASDSVITSQTGGVNHASDPIKLGEYAYTWTAGANLGNQTGGESSRRDLGVRIGHLLNRNIALAEGSALSINASQNYSRLSDTLLSTSQSLVHSAGASWSRRSGEAATTMLSLTGSDSRTTGYLKQHFQLVNLQANGQLAFSRWDSVNANMTFQAVRQSSFSAFLTGTTAAPAGNFSTGTGSSFSTGIGGNLNYQHTRAFGVPRLRYYALLNLNQYQVRTRFEGDIDAPIERVNWAFEQRLDYDIGRLQTRLSLRVAEIEGRTNGMIFFRVLRQFGGF